ncbi:MAG: AIM24 family protein [Sphingobacteriales bacterium]|jgi:uncharacterized protein (AIM24 family)|nr:AIM24 family protein [Sphingobacteriales bacterium]MCC7223314.1 AIM24 family protein [Chitinophagales bacterium]
MKYSVAEFVRQTSQRNEENNFFDLESSQTLEVNLNGSVWAKLGAMIAYKGNISFKRQGLSEQGLSMVFKKMLSGEGMTLMKAEGTGKLYLADNGKKVRILHLNNETIFVNGNDVLAIENTLQYDIKMMKSVAGMLGGGLFNVKISGTGMVAMTTHGDPITLLVSPDQPLNTDANATVAWSGGLDVVVKTDVSFSDFIGRGSGESIQLAFSGDGWVVLQPYEEVYGEKK